jgi:hypothetical protein
MREKHCWLADFTDPVIIEEQYATTTFHVRPATSSLMHTSEKERRYHHSS